jgi:uncharacterized protein (TIGR00297 family)
MENTAQLLLGMLLGALIAALAWRLRSLKLSGAVAAAISGGLVFGLGGLSWAVLLLAFFISSSALSQIFSRRKAAVDPKYSKGSQRDWGQVLANGGLGAALAVLYGIYPQYGWIWIAFAGAMAAVNADTWATEVGFFSPVHPRLITNARQVEPGTSGGVTPLGYLAALCGSALIALLAALFTPSANPLFLAALITLGGIGGSTFDSLLGATVQAIYFCPTCNKETERHPTHSCGTQTVQVRGWRWLQNDWVYFFCSLAGALLAAGLYSLFLQ